MPGSYLQPMPEVAGVEHIYVNAGGLRMHVATAGPEDGPPVMLLHGWPQHWWLWRNVMPALAAEGYRVYAPDLRGLGWSEATERCCDYDKRQFARDIVALLDVLEIDKVKLAGHDWGGWTGFLVAMTAPERVEKYVAMNITPPWLDPGPFDLGKLLKATSRLWYQVLMATPGLSRIAQAGPAKPIFAKRMVGSAHNIKVWGDGAIDTYLNQFEDRRRSDASMYIYRRFITAELPQIQFGKYLEDRRLTTPTKLLFGLEDIAIDPEILDGPHEKFADDMTIERVENCGHFIVDEQPELVARTLIDFYA